MNTPPAMTSMRRARSRTGTLLTVGLIAAALLLSVAIAWLRHETTQLRLSGERLRGELALTKGQSMDHMSQVETASGFDEWAIVELFGHQRVAGRVTEQQVGGESFIRVDVPDVEGKPGFTRLFGGKAIYAITPVSRDIAEKVASYVDAVPVRPYELEAPIHAGGSE